MTANIHEEYTEEQILSELIKFGCTDVTPELLRTIKEDVNAQLRNAVSRSCSPLSAGADDDNGIIHDEMNHSYPASSTGSGSLSNASSSSAISITLDPDVEQRHRSRFQNFLEENIVNSQVKNRPSSSHNVGRPSNKENHLTDSAQGKKHNMIKRKVLRLVDGKKILMEEIRPMPDFTSTTSDSNGNSLRKKSSSSDELWQRMSSVSLSSRSSSSSSSDRNRGQSRQSGVILPNLYARRKKYDPVTRYHEYRKYWDTFRLPGENKHSHLRWTIRERMMEFEFC